MNSYYVGLLIQASISIIAITGIFALTGLAGMFSLGQAAYMAIGAYITFILAAKTGLSFWITSLGGIGACMLVAWLAAMPTVRLRKDYFSLISVGLGQTITALLITFSDITNGSQGFSKIPKVKHLLPLALLVTALSIFCVRNLKYSRYGRMSIALKNDELAAKSFGIDVYKLKIKVYILGSVIAGLAGILYGLQNRVLLPESFGWTASSEQEIFLFFGGTNSLTGAVISAALLKCLPEFFRNVTLFGQSLQEYRTILYCILILLIINFRPSGLMGEHEINFSRLRERLSGRRKKEGGSDG
ncbi:MULTISPECIES: branched-chain amino acid ABC transporter permease [Anaerotruncus]|jgi:branched-chain amino acid transport system permease protein|uniref:branched-chain amino acid ABC transporter permease n=1 Tax=Anaerotruncus TaxID=244127 RepID=UPI0021719177|nr:MULTISPECIES: branched-chain amino acid ABC transporter permease [Anaerotruncus]MCI8493246.1 branched-chain amino acid ABC transporter permease [Anaerotruncus sp.]